MILMVLYMIDMIDINGIYAENRLPKIKDEAYIIGLLEYKLIGAH